MRIRLKIGYGIVGGILLSAVGYFSYVTGIQAVEEWDLPLPIGISIIPVGCLTIYGLVRLLVWCFSEPKRNKSKERR